MEWNLFKLYLCTSRFYYQRVSSSVNIRFTKVNVNFVHRLPKKEINFHRSKQKDCNLRYIKAIHSFKLSKIVSTCQPCMCGNCISDTSRTRRGSAQNTSHPTIIYEYFGFRT